MPTREQQHDTYWRNPDLYRELARKNMRKYRLKPEVRLRESQRAAEQVKKRRRIIRRHKQLKGCMDCGTHDPIILEYDHRPENPKSFGIGTSVGSVCSWQRLKEEIHKCDVVCANCHRQRTAKRGTENE